MVEVRGGGCGEPEVSRPGRAPGKTCEVDECRQEAGKCMPSCSDLYLQSLSSLFGVTREALSSSTFPSSLVFSPL